MVRQVGPQERGVERIVDADQHRVGGRDPPPVPVLDRGAGHVVGHPRGRQGEEESPSAPVHPSTRTRCVTASGRRSAASRTTSLLLCLPPAPPARRGDRSARRRRRRGCATRPCGRAFARPLAEAGERRGDDAVDPGGRQGEGEPATSTRRRARHRGRARGPSAHHRDVVVDLVQRELVDRDRVRGVQPRASRTRSRRAGSTGRTSRRRGSARRPRAAPRPPRRAAPDRCWSGGSAPVVRAQRRPHVEPSDAVVADHDPVAAARQEVALQPRAPRSGPRRSRTSTAGPAACAGPGGPRT